MRFATVVMAMALHAASLLVRAGIELGWLPVLSLLRARIPWPVITLL
ncbi:hypothetical protein ACIGB6_20320 [Paeniglutamicibacter gangotriensis]